MDTGAFNTEIISTTLHVDKEESMSPVGHVY